MSGDTAGNPLGHCTSVTPSCPVSATILTYQPSIAANTFFLAWFGVTCLPQILIGIKTRTWAFMTAVGLGCLPEVLGYVGRVMLYTNPWSKVGFRLQIILLVIGPAFTAAGIYLTLKHMVRLLGEEHSIIRPALYTWIFISADIISLVLQGAGGGISASAESESSMRTGTWIALAGIIFQVISLLAFGLLAALYSISLRRSRTRRVGALTNRKARRNFSTVVAALVIAYVTVLIRCLYRIRELLDGWRNPVMLNEADFIVLDGVMISIAVLVLTLFHPGLVFPGLLRDELRSKPHESAEEKMHQALSSVGIDHLRDFTGYRGISS